MEGRTIASTPPLARGQKPEGSHRAPSPWVREVSLWVSFPCRAAPLSRTPQTPGCPACHLELWCYPTDTVLPSGLSAFFRGKVCHSLWFVPLLFVGHQFSLPHKEYFISFCPVAWVPESEQVRDTLASHDLCEIRVSSYHGESVVLSSSPFYIPFPLLPTDWACFFQSYESHKW